MNKDEIKGKAKDIKGRIERQAGEWTGDSGLQAKGAADQVEGKVQNTVGKVKDAGKKMMRDLDRKTDGNLRDEDLREEPRGRKRA
jgi:uncharacterized protein YjbJ (UPF0337 family)